MIIGPSLGGLLANPTKIYPNLFGGIEFLEMNPYFLPCACSSLFSVVGFIVGYLFLPETNKFILESTCSQASDDLVVNEDQPLLAAADTLAEIPQENTSTNNDIGRNAKASILAYALLAFMGIIAFEIIPLWTVSAPPIGFAWTAKDLGICLSSIGAVSFLCQVIVYPTVSRKYDALELYKYPMYVYPVFFVSLPLISTFLGNDRTTAFIVVGIVMGAKAIIDNVVVTSVMILASFL